MTLRPPRSLWILMVAVTALFFTLTIVAFLIDLEWWYRLGFIALACLCPAGLAELATDRVELQSDTLVVVNNFRRRTVPRANVVAVTWGKGVGISVKLADDSWLKLPAVGKGGLGVVNTIRAWIKRTPKSLAMPS